MSKGLKVLNLVLVISFLIELGSILFMISIGFNQYNMMIHKANGLVLILLILGHLALNRQWIKNAFCPRK